jgi:hypothetical protein
MGESAGARGGKSSGFATTTTRIGFGAFPLSFALFSLGCLLSGRLVAGVSLVATVDATVMAVRLFSLSADGPVAESIRLFLPEVILLLLSISGLLLERARDRQKRETAHEARTRLSAEATGT